MTTEAPQKIRVVCRIRGGCPAAPVFDVVGAGGGGDSQGLLFPDGKEYRLDSILGPSSTDEDCFRALLEDSLPDFIRGVNVCCMAYGQSGAGKTHSFNGIINVFGQKLFKMLEQLDSASVSVSYYEVFNEKVFDLLSAKRSPLRIRGTAEPHVEGLVAIEVHSAQELRCHYFAGNARRSKAAMLLNEQSSRSHAVFMITVRRKRHSGDVISFGRCFVVDLAGSEKLSLDSSRPKETLSINKSLFALQRVIEARARNDSFVQYRDSVLTRLLQLCFNGDAKTSILAAVRPDASFLNETLRTLQFASKASEIIVRPMHHDDPVNTNMTAVKAANELVNSDLVAMHACEARRLVLFGMPKPPCLVSLFSDDFLNTWDAMDSGYNITDVLGTVFAVVDAKEEGLAVTAKCAEFYVNGECLAPEQNALLANGDRLAIRGASFFGVLLTNDPAVVSRMSYAAAKLEFIEKQFVLQHRYIVDRCIDEVDSAEAEIQEAVKVDISDVTKRISELQKVEKDNISPKTVSKAISERIELEKYLKNVKTLSKNLKENIGRERQDIKAFGPNQVDKNALVEVRSRVDFLNSLIRGLPDPVVSNLRFDAQLQKDGIEVRVFNPGESTCGTFGLDEFNEGYAVVSQAIAADATPPELVSAVRSVVFGSSGRWSEVRFTKGSTVIVNAVRSSISSLAKMRNSTVSEVCNVFAGRKSKLSSLMRDSVGGFSDNLDMMFSAITWPTVTSHESWSGSVAIGMQALGLLKALDTFSDFSQARENANRHMDFMVNQLRISQHLHAICELWQVFEHSNDDMYVDINFADNRDNIAAICEHIKACVNNRNVIVSHVIKEIETRVHRLIVFIGDTMFSHRIAPPPEMDPIRDHVERGFKQAIGVLLAGVEVDVVRYEEGSDERSCTLYSLACMSLALKEHLATCQFMELTWEQRLFVYFDVVRPIVMIRECIIWLRRTIASNFNQIHKAVKAAREAGNNTITLEVKTELSKHYVKLRKFYEQQPATNSATVA